MTHFKVSDEAVEAALSCLPFMASNDPSRKCLTTVDQYLSGFTPEMRAQFIRAAIEAALPVMFDLAGWQFRLTHGAGFTSWSWAGDTQEMEWHKSLYVADEAEDRIEFRAIYATKESK